MKFLKSTLIVLTVFSVTKPIAQLSTEELNILWSLVGEEIKFEISDSFYQYIEETNYDTLISELERNDSSRFENKLNDPIFCFSIGFYLKSNIKKASQSSKVKQKFCYFFSRAADLLLDQNLNHDQSLLRQQFSILKYCDNACTSFNDFSLLQKRLSISKALKDTNKICGVFLQTARRLKSISDIKSAKKYLDSSYYYYNMLKPSLRNESLLFELTQTKGQFFWFENELEIAYIYFQKALQIAQKQCIKNPGKIDLVLNEFLATRNLSQLMLVYDEGDKAINLYESFISKYDTSFMDFHNLATLYNDLGDFYSSNTTRYSESDRLSISTNYYKKSLYFRKRNNNNYIGWTYRGLGSTLIYHSKVDQGLKYLDSAEHHFLVSGESNGLYGVYLIKAGHFYRVNNLDLAMEYANKSIDINSKFNLGIQKVKFNYFLKNKNYEKLVDISKTIIGYADSIGSEYSSFSRLKNIDDKRNLEISMKNDSVNYSNKIIIQQEKISSEKQLRNFLIIISLLVIVSLGLVFTQLKKVRKGKELVEEKQQEITDSINYAKRLQQGILVPFDLVQTWLSESFIFFKPKDIVSGDFYWIEKVGNKVYFAVADCTGHGIPGALVSIICSNALTKSLYEDFTYEPSRMLDNTRAIVEERFVRSKDEIKDGMDISLCCLNVEEKSITWAGAMNPLWIVRKGSNEVEELKPDRQSIGMVEKPKRYKQHEVKLAKGDSVYLFSDGFQDQFGGEKGRKYMKGRFKKFVLSIQDQDMQTQLTSFEKEFNTWKGDREQIDDVCVMGVRIT